MSDTISTFDGSHKKVAKVDGEFLRWPTETWRRKSACNRLVTKWPDPPPRPKLEKVARVSELRYASDTISYHFGDGKPLEGLVSDIQQKKINVLHHENLILECVALPEKKALYCLNNRRLWCLKQCDAENPPLCVRVKVYDFSDSAAFFQSRITSVNDGLKVLIRKSKGGDGCRLEEDMPETLHISSKRKAEYIHLTCDGFQVDVLISCTPTLSGKKLGEEILKEDWGQRHRWAAVCAAAHSKMLQLSSMQCKAVKLAKLWAWYVAFPRWDEKRRPRSFLIELIVRHICLSAKSMSAWDIFLEFLRFCAAKKIQPIMWDWTELGKDPRLNWGEGPRIIDPLNPTNNVARPFRFWSFLRKYARQSLQKMGYAVCIASQKSQREWSEDDEAIPKVPPPNPDEVRKVLQKMHLPTDAVERLLDSGFTSLEVLCQLGTKSDFLEAGMNKVQSRLLWKALRDRGYIFKKLESAGRASQATSQALQIDVSSYSEQDTSHVDEPESSDEAIPLNCYPAQGQEGMARCFLFGTLVPVLGGGKIAVEELQEGRDTIIAASGRPLLVKSVKTHDLGWKWLVELTAQGARLTVTETHRMQRLEKSKWVDVKARDLKKGDMVLCTNGGSKLEAVDHLSQQAKTVEVVVHPDEVFQAFHAPSTSFLCKGQAGHGPPINCRICDTFLHSQVRKQDL